MVGGGSHLKCYFQDRTKSWSYNIIWWSYWNNMPQIHSRGKTGWIKSLLYWMYQVTPDSCSFQNIRNRHLFLRIFRNKISIRPPNNIEENWIPIPNHFLWLIWSFKIRSFKSRSIFKWTFHGDLPWWCHKIGKAFKNCWPLSQHLNKLTYNPIQWIVSIVEPR